jgi:hypothetical protein
MKWIVALWLELVAIGPIAAYAQEATQTASTNLMPVIIKKPGEIKFKQRSFTFVRIKYSGVGRMGASIWASDFPEADRNFTTQFQKAIGLKSDTNGMVMELTDPLLKQQPFIYIVKGGHLHMSDEEVRSLRDYLLGGGFLMVDDFWGEAEWESFSAELRRVFPDRKPVNLPLNHELFNCFYEMRERPQVPHVTIGIRSQYTGITWSRPDAKEAHYRGLVDDSGRLMAVFCHNTDLGDGWEHPDDDPYYFHEFCAKKAYPMGINIVVYALSH